MTARSNIRSWRQWNRQVALIMTTSGVGLILLDCGAAAPQEEPGSLPAQEVAAPQVDPTLTPAPTAPLLVASLPTSTPIPAPTITLPMTAPITLPDPSVSPIPKISVLPPLPTRPATPTPVPTITATPAPTPTLESPTPDSIPTTATARPSAIPKVISCRGGGGGNVYICAPWPTPDPPPKYPNLDRVLSAMAVAEEMVDANIPQPTRIPRAMEIWMHAGADPKEFAAEVKRQGGVAEVRGSENDPYVYAPDGLPGGLDFRKVHTIFLPNGDSNAPYYSQDPDELIQHLVIRMASLSHTNALTAWIKGRGGNAAVKEREDAIWIQAEVPARFLGKMSQQEGVQSAIMLTPLVVRVPALEMIGCPPPGMTPPPRVTWDQENC